MFVSENVAVTASDASQPRALPPARGMGVLAFGDSSTWTLERDGSTGRGASAKARRAARFGDGKLPRREDDDADGTARAGVTPRNAWPEGTFTITYPRGYDPARGRFVRGGEGDAEARVRVEKAPARARREAEAASRAEIDEAAREAAAALRLDEAYLERVRAQRREASRRRDERRKGIYINEGKGPPMSRRDEHRTDAAFFRTERTNAHEAPTARDADSDELAVSRDEDAKIRGETKIHGWLAASVGVDGAYLARVREQGTKRRDVLEAKRKRVLAEAEAIASARGARLKKNAPDAAPSTDSKHPSRAAEEAEYAALYTRHAAERDAERARVVAGRAAAAKRDAANAGICGSGKGKKKRRRLVGGE